LLRGLVLQALLGIRSERLLCEQLGYNMLYSWFGSV
jgi:transposase